MCGDHPHSPTSAPFTRGASLRAQDGFTLIEIIVSALIVVLIATAVAQALISGAHMSGYQLVRSQADQLAQQDEERMRSLSPKQLNSYAQAQTQTVALGGTNYTISSQASLLGTGGASSCSTAGTGAVAYYHTASTVSWTDSNGTHSLSEDSDITPPVGGSLLAQVVDQTGANLAGVNVTATGQTSGGDVEGGTTDTNGCVIFSGLSPDTYNLSFSATNYVDVNGNAPVTDTATATPSGTARPTNTPETMGLAGSVSANFLTQAYTTDTGTTVGPTPANQLAGGLAWYGAGSTLSMSASKFTNASATAGSASIATSDLFPFAFTGPPVSYTSNYHVWAGECRGEEPPSSFAGDVATVTPGLAQTLTVQEPGAILLVNYNGSRVVPNDVHLTYASAAPSCSDKWIETIRGTSPSYNLAKTSTNGALAYPGVPYVSNQTTGATASASGISGSLAFCADYFTGGSWHQATTNVTSLSMTTPTTVNVNIPTTNSGSGCS